MLLYMQLPVFLSHKQLQLFPHTTLTDWFFQPKRRVFTARYEMNNLISSELILILKVLIDIKLYLMQTEF